MSLDPRSLDPTNLGQDGRLAVTRIRFLSGDPVAGGVRSPILASWRRSRAERVAADRIDRVLVPDPDLDTPLSRVAAPILRDLYAALAGESVSIVLTDARGMVLTRLTGDAALERKLDKVALAPGFVYAEGVVGTNGIGTALESGTAMHVFGHEHYAENLEDLACAGVPIHHPITGRIVGLVDLTCWSRDAGALLPALATTTAKQVERASMAATGVAERELFDEYLRTCRRSRGVVLAVGAEVGMLNEDARATLSAADQSALLAHAAEALSERSQGGRDVDLPSGTAARLNSHLVRHGDAVVGLVARVRHRSDPSVRLDGSRAQRSASRPLSGVVGSATTWQRTCGEVEQVFLAGEWLALAGEHGVGKLALLKAVQLRRHPVPHLSVFDAADSDREHWLSELHEALSVAGASVVLRHVDALEGPRLRRVVALLQEARAAGEGPWVAVTVGEPTAAPDLEELFALFPSTVTVPPLRMRAGDVPALSAHLLARMAHGRPPTCSAATLGVLTRASWAGNVAELEQVLRDVLAHRRTGTIEPADLPPGTRAATRRTFSVMELLERDAIVHALIDAGGDKAAAAEALGMSRATVYRRIRAFGIVDDLA